MFYLPTKEDIRYLIKNGLVVLGEIQDRRGTKKTISCFTALLTNIYKDLEEIDNNLRSGKTVKSKLPSLAGIELVENVEILFDEEKIHSIVAKSKRRNKKICWLCDILVDSEYQGKGVGPVIETEGFKELSVHHGYDFGMGDIYNLISGGKDAKADQDKKYRKLDAANNRSNKMHIKIMKGEVIGDKNRLYKRIGQSEEAWTIAIYPQVINFNLNRTLTDPKFITGYTKHVKF